MISQKDDIAEKKTNGFGFILAEIKEDKRRAPEFTSVNEDARNRSLTQISAGSEKLRVLRYFWIYFL